MRIAPLLLLTSACVQDIKLYEQEPDVLEVVDTDLPAAPDVEPAAGTAAASVSPPALDFGYLTEGETASASVTLTSDGDAPLDVLDVRLEGASAFTSPDLATPRTVPAGGALTLNVDFLSPATDAAATLVIATNDPSAPELTVALTGTGADPALAGDRLDFGWVALGTTATRPWTLRNPGNHPVVVRTAQSSDAVFAIDLPSPVTIPAGGAVEVDATFTPAAIGDVVGTLTLDSDARTAVAPVFARGAGADAPSVACRASATAVDAGQTVHLVGGQSSDPANRPLTGTWTLTRAPAASTLTLPNSGDLNVGPLTLDAPGTYEMSLVVTNDLGLTSPACAVTVQASADAPVAVCSASPPVVAAIHETFRLLGSSSYDPSGRPITGATWTLTGRPPGSALVLPAGSGPDTAPLSADVVGTYTAELVVTNDLGVASAPCEATVTAEADSALWVELSWQHAEDIDLHLVRGTGDTFSSDDCYFANCRSGLAWGGPRVLDDPILDLDDISGTGPENINIPEPVADTYTVVVHDYDWGSANFGGANTATIKVYVDGILYLLDSRVLVGEDAEEAVAEIDLTGMMPVVTPL